MSPIDIEYHPRFKYNQASPEEKAALERKFRAQQELKQALMTQMEEKKARDSLSPSYVKRRT